MLAEKMKQEFNEFMEEYRALDSDELLQELESLGITFSDYCETDVYSLADIHKYSSEINNHTNNLLLCA